MNGFCHIEKGLVNAEFLNVRGVFLKKLYQRIPMRLICEPFPLQLAEMPNPAMELSWQNQFLPNSTEFLQQSPWCQL